MKIASQLNFGFKWLPKNKNRLVRAKAKNASQNSELDIYINQLGSGLAYEGSRYAVFNADRNGESNYKVFNSKEELLNEYHIPDLEVSI